MTFPATWTPERDAELKRLRAEGVSVSKIGEALGVSRNAIAGRLFRLGLTEPSKNPIIPKPKPIRGRVAHKERPDASSVRMADLTKSQCRWPLWNNKDGGGPDFWSCGHPVAGGVYCAAHMAVAFRPANAPPSEKVKQTIAKLYLGGTDKDQISVEVSVPKSIVLQTLFQSGLIQNRAMAGL